MRIFFALMILACVVTLLVCALISAWVFLPTVGAISGSALVGIFVGMWGMNYFHGA